MKKIVLFLFFLLVPLSLLASIKGDVNNDGKVNVTDYILIRKHLLGYNALSDTELTNADVDGNGKVGVSDYIAIKKIILFGNPTATPTATVETITPSPTASSSSKTSKIHFIASNNDTKLNSGDAILLESNGHFGMVDTGLNNSTDNKNLLKYLKKVGVTKLDFVLLTHTHRDHSGGLAYLLKNLPIEKIYLKSYNIDKMTSTYKKIFNEIETLSQEKGTEIIYVDKVYNDGDVIDLQSMKISLYNVAQNKNKTLHYESDGKTIVENKVNDNSNSILQLINVKGFKVLLTGDLYDEKENIKYFTKLSKKSEFQKLDILKMPHHGNKRSAFGGEKDGTYNQTLYNRFSPKYVVVTGLYCQICEYLGAKDTYKVNNYTALVFTFGKKISLKKVT